MSDTNCISIDELFNLVGTPLAPLLIDVCVDSDFQEDPRIIPGATRMSHRCIPPFLPLADKYSIVVICQKGLKLSQGTAAVLRARGYHALYLAGGNFAWRDAGYPLLPTKHINARAFDQERIFVAPTSPDIHEMASMWLLKRFVDPTAEYIFVERPVVEDVADRFSAIPVCNGSGQSRISLFDEWLANLNLNTDRLLQMALLMEDSQSSKSAKSPQSAGFVAAFDGLLDGRPIELDILEKGCILLDAFYCWTGRNTKPAKVGGTAS